MAKNVGSDQSGWILWKRVYMAPGHGTTFTWMETAKECVLLMGGDNVGPNGRSV